MLLLRARDVNVDIRRKRPTSRALNILAPPRGPGDHSMTTTSSRRRFIADAGFAGALAAWGPRVYAASGAPAATTRARYFSLRDARLTTGPFLAAQQLDADYLLRLEPDRMLHNFRRNAGLAPKAAVYGGWESVEPWIDIRCHGHTLGHYLTACACMFESTDDPRFAARVDYIVAELAECQAKRGSGIVSAFPDDLAPLVDSLAGKPFAGVPWYTLHKVMAGVRDAHLHRGSSEALAVLRRIADWIVDATAGVSEAAFQKMLDREHGGMSEVLADLHGLTGDTRYQALALRFCHRALLDPLSAGQDRLDGLHANTQIPKVIGFSRLFDADASASHLDRAAKTFWRAVADERSFATGGHGDGEHFFPKHEFPAHLGSAKTMETCCTHNMLKLTRSLYAREPASNYFDYFERGLFNGILASQDPLTGMNTYFQATRPGYVRLYHTPFDSFWCCTGSGIENHAKYAESIYAHDDDTLYVNLFLASTLRWRGRGISVTQATRFPDEDVTTLTFAMERPAAMTLAIRQPAWCAAMNVRVNGRRERISRRAGDYCRLQRTFRAGDVVEVRMPMTLALEPLPNSPEHAALVFGPIVLAARLGTQGLAPGSQLIVNERESGKMLNDSVPIPQWPRPLAELLASTTRIGDTLEFTTRGFAGGREVRFAPYFRLTHERYNLYWKQSG
jgi:DUF1680 family protein